MVARVDRALKEDLGIADGLAADNVYVLDPCCGTGAYLGEVLRRIALNLKDQGLGALTGARVKQAALERVFGFEIMPAPFVVAHLQVGLTMQELDAPLADDADERAGVFLTNALTGWEPTVQKPLPFPELEEERDRAQRIKQDTPVLVILGNPPYNGFAGMAVDEERELSRAYRTTRRVRRPEGQGLNDLYVRFFRMAERRIVEKTGQGVVCFISNYSWLDGLSFTGDARALSGGLRRYPDRQCQRRQVPNRQDRARRLARPPASFPRRRTRSAYRSERPSLRSSAGPITLPLVRSSSATSGGNPSAMSFWRRRRRDRVSYMTASSRCCPWACPLHGRPSARTGSTGPRCRTCFRNRFRESRPAAMPFS